MPKNLKTQCCIVGGGPAGMMLGYLLARQGIEVVVAEKHADFLRDFRGDTVHPSTLEIFHELGLLEEFLKQPHQRTEGLSLNISGETLHVSNFRNLKVHAPFIAMMPQWDLLNFIAQKAKAYPNFTLLQSTKAEALLFENGTVRGAKMRAADKVFEVSADLTVGCDGRDSLIRAQSALPVLNLGAPIDVFWMRLPRSGDENGESMGAINNHGFLVLINRGDYWQCAMPFPKGSADAIKSLGLDAFRARIVDIEPALAGAVSALKSWEDVKLLNVQVNRLEKWYRDGCLCIGDAAHAMSPVGGVGINLAVQDAVAAARILGKAFNGTGINTSVLAEVQKRRERAARLTQKVQIMAHDRVLIPAITKNEPIKPPWFLKLINLVPALQGLSARMIGLGVQPEHWTLDE